MFSMSKPFPQKIYYLKHSLETQIQKIMPTNFYFPLLIQTFPIPLPFSQ